MVAVAATLGQAFLPSSLQHQQQRRAAGRDHGWFGPSRPPAHGDLDAQQHKPGGGATQRFMGPAGHQTLTSSGGGYAASPRGGGEQPGRGGGGGGSKKKGANSSSKKGGEKKGQQRDLWAKTFGPNKEESAVPRSAAANPTEPKTGGSKQQQQQGLPPPPKLSKAAARSPVLKLLLERHPELVGKSTEDLERELDAKFEKNIQKRGATYYFAEDDEEELLAEEARLNPMSSPATAQSLLFGTTTNKGGKKQQQGVLRAFGGEDMEVEELGDEEMRALGLELEGEDDEDDEEVVEEEEEGGDDDVVMTFKGWGAAERRDEEEGVVALKDTGLETRTYFKLRPPQQTEEEEQQRLATRQAGSRAATTREQRQQPPPQEKRRGLQAPPTEPLTGPSREGGDLRFRRGNLFSLVNMGRDEDLMEKGQTFMSLGLTRPGLLRNLQELGFSSPTTIQAASFPLLLHGKSAVLHSYTGSGKTLAYLLPLLQRVDPEATSIQLVILAPSRELASQIAQVANQVTEGTGVMCVSLIGGASLQRQVDRLRQERPQVIVGTPGRVAELVLDKRKARVGAATMLVLDEVDLLLDDSYQGEVRMVIKAMSRLDQAVFASATGCSPGVTALAAEVMKGGYDMIRSSNGAAITKGSDGSSSSSSGSSKVGDIELPRNLRHGLFIAPPGKLVDALRRLLNTEPKPEGVMVFVNDATKVKGIVDYLSDKGLEVAGLHGDSSKQERALTISRLTSGRLKIVVSTDVAARGLDVPTLTHVVNLDLPSNVQQYVHRAGRCGRAGRPGIVVSFSPPSTSFVLTKFSRQLGIAVERVDIAHNRLILFDEAQLPAHTQKPPRTKKRPPRQAAAAAAAAAAGTSTTQQPQGEGGAGQQQEQEEGNIN